MNDLNDYLTEQLKDPEFAAAWERAAEREHRCPFAFTAAQYRHYRGLTVREERWLRRWLSKEEGRLRRADPTGRRLARMHRARRARRGRRW